MIKNIKDLERLIKVCRKHNILTIKVDGAELMLGNQSQAPKVQLDAFPELPGITADMPIPAPTILSAEDKREIAEQGAIDTDLPSDEELLFYSADNGPQNQ